MTMSEGAPRKGTRSGVVSPVPARARATLAAWAKAHGAAATEPIRLLKKGCSEAFDKLRPNANVQ